MALIYNIVLNTIQTVLPLLRKWGFIKRDTKLNLFIKGQQNVFKSIEQTLQKGRDGRPIVWIHASSLGEYAIARPLIKSIREKAEQQVFLTFFSPTGIEALCDKTHDLDYVEYLPLDTPANVRRFLELVKPEKAIFMVSEFWPNYLHHLHKQHIPTYLASGLVTSKSSIMKWYSGMMRRELKAFTRFSVLNQSSKTHLQQIGFNNVTITGDLLFDNGIKMRETPYHNPIIASFSQGQEVFIAGSVSDKKDLRLMRKLANKYQHIKFIIVPHEISVENIHHIASQFQGGTICYHECTPETDFQHTQVMIIDFIGALAYMYRYAKWAYVGGGFTSSLHSVVEPAVYGLPIAFGPNIYRQVTAVAISQKKIGKIVHDFNELDQWFSALLCDPSLNRMIRETALAHVEANAGATTEVMNIMGL